MSKQLIITLAIVGGAFAFGYYVAPEKIKTEIKTVEVIKEVVKRVVDKSQNKRKTTTIVQNKDGSSTTTITEETVTETSSETDKNRDTSIAKDETKEVTKSGSRLSLSALGGLNLKDGTPVYGGHVQRELIGPITIGVWGMSNVTGGFSLGLNF